MKALMIGCGNMGGALLSRWVDEGSVSFTVVDPVTAFEHPKVEVLRSASGLEQGTFDLAIIAIKPQLLEKVLPDYLPLLKSDAAMVSMAAGVAANRISQLCGGRAVIRIMPNMPVSVGKGMSGLYAQPDVDQKHKNAVEAIMGTTGEVLEVGDEDLIDRITAVAGSGPGYVFEIARAYTEAAAELGFSPEQSRKLVLGTMAGAVEMAQQSPDTLSDLRNAVTSKAGTTEAGLNALNGDQSLSQLMNSTLNAAYKRSLELR